MYPVTLWTKLTYRVIYFTHTKECYGQTIKQKMDIVPSNTVDKYKLTESFTLYIPKNAMDKLSNKDWTLYPVTQWTKINLLSHLLYTTNESYGQSTKQRMDIVPSNTMDKT